MKILLTSQFDFELEERLEIVQTLRNLVPTEIQENWLDADDTGRWTLKDPPPGPQEFFMSLVLLFSVSTGLFTYL